MPYIQEICVAGRTVEIDRHYSYHFGKHWVREKAHTPTTATQKKANLRKAVKDLRRILNANFKDGEDCLLTLDFRPENRPKNSREMLNIMQKFCRRMRSEYLEAGYPLRYVYVMEIGPRGAEHAHMVVTWNNLPIFWKCWIWGGIHVKPLDTYGQYSGVAEYFVKYSLRTEKTEGKQLGKRWYGSRNLIRPVPRKRVIHAEHWMTKIREKPGYYIDKNSVREGVSDLTGMPFFCYTYIKLRC